MELLSDQARIVRDLHDRIRDGSPGDDCAASRAAHNTRQAATFAEGGKHADRVARNPDVYGEIETRLAAFGAAPAKPVVAEAVVAAPATLEESVAPTWWPALVFGYLFGFAVVWLRLSSDHRLEEGLP